MGRDLRIGGTDRPANLASRLRSIGDIDSTGRRTLGESDTSRGADASLTTQITTATMAATINTMMSRFSRDEIDDKSMFIGIRTSHGCE